MIHWHFKKKVQPQAYISKRRHGRRPPRLPTQAGTSTGSGAELPAVAPARRALMTSLSLSRLRFLVTTGRMTTAVASKCRAQNESLINEAALFLLPV